MGEPAESGHDSPRTAALASISSASERSFVNNAEANGSAVESASETSQPALYSNKMQQRSERENPEIMKSNAFRMSTLVLNSDDDFDSGTSVEFKDAAQHVAQTANMPGALVLESASAPVENGTKLLQEESDSFVLPLRDQRGPAGVITHNRVRMAPDPNVVSLTVDADSVTSAANENASYSRLGLLSFSQEDRRPGVRQDEERIRELETENFSLKLKVNYYEKLNVNDSAIETLRKQLADADKERRELEIEIARLRTRLTALGKQKEKEMDEEFEQQDTKLRQVLEESKQLQSENKELRDKVDGQEDKINNQAEKIEQLNKQVEEFKLRENKTQSELETHYKEEILSLQEELEKVKQENKEFQDYVDFVVSELSLAKEVQETRLETITKALKDINTRAPYLAPNFPTTLNEGINFLIESVHAALDEQVDLNTARQAFMSQMLTLIPDVKLVEEAQIPQYLADQLRALRDNIGALEKQNETQQQRLEDMGSLMDELRMSARETPESTMMIQRLQNEVSMLYQEQEKQKANAEYNFKLANMTRKQNYETIREFFMCLDRWFGDEWSKESAQRLQEIYDTAKKNGSSKLIPLRNLMFEFLDRLCQNQVKYNAKNKEYEERSKQLESLLLMELDKRGADKVLLARYRNLQDMLKKEKEKRQLEYQGYIRQLQLRSSTSFGDQAAS